MLTKEERLAHKLEKERQKQEQKELKEKAKEFTKKVFFYDLAKKSISREIKQELGKLGAFKPFYSDNENERAILFIDMWKSDKKEVRFIVLNEAQKDFEKFMPVE